MIKSVDQTSDIADLFITETVERKLRNSTRVLIKINLAGPPIKNKHPRTDEALLRSLLTLLIDHGKVVTICESADGYLSDNLDSIGIRPLLESMGVRYVDIDTVEFYKVSVDNQKILIPRFFNDFDLRISMPCTSKREGMLFSNNIKNFFGATPRIGYIRQGKGRWRSALHDDLTQSVINVFDAFERYSKFDFFINGGNAYSEKRGSFDIEKIYLSDDAIELDRYVFNRYFSQDEKPDYMIEMEKRLVQQVY
ncbi:MAG: DUF362 domain-containing protein [Proteobacteria bacterium]|nr:DUF362 domain-containing protein [Pseudomonadota bacterium]